MIVKNSHLKTYQSNINVLLESVLYINTDNFKDKTSSISKKSLMNNFNTTNESWDDNLPVSFLEKRGVINKRKKVMI